VNAVEVLAIPRKPHGSDLPQLCQGSAIESIPDAAHIKQVARLRRHGFDLLAQIGDLIVHHAVGNEYPVAPDLVEQLVTRQNAAGIANESREQLELRGCDLDAPAGAADLVTGEIDLRSDRTLERPRKIRVASVLPRNNSGAGSTVSLLVSASIMTASRLGLSRIFW
jgi:hypothetical protein